MLTGKNIRDRALAGDIIACKDDTWIDKVIRLITRGSYTHVALYVGDGLVLESSWVGLKLSRLSTKRGKYELYRVPGIDAAQRVDIIKYAAHRIDSKYDFKLLFAVGVKILLGIDLGWDDPNKFICTEIIIDALRVNGVKVKEELDPDDFVRQFERIW